MMSAKRLKWITVLCHSLLSGELSITLRGSSQIVVWLSWIQECFNKRNTVLRRQLDDLVFPNGLFRCCLKTADHEISQAASREIGGPLYQCLLVGRDSCFKPFALR